MNSKIDHWYTNDTRTNIGSICILKAHEPEYFKDKPLRTRTLSDHLAILMSVDFEIIESLRVTKIDKQRMLKKVQELNSMNLYRAKTDPMLTFRELREQMKTNNQNANARCKHSSMLIDTRTVDTHVFC